MAWAALTGPMPRRSSNPGTRSLTMVSSWARLALTAREAASNASAQRPISACRTACSPARVISTVDPEARHAHKTRHRRQDGYKAHVKVEPDSGLPT